MLPLPIVSNRLIQFSWCKHHKICTTQLMRKTLALHTPIYVCYPFEQAAWLNYYFPLDIDSGYCCLHAASPSGRINKTARLCLLQLTPTKTTSHNAKPRHKEYSRAYSIRRRDRFQWTRIADEKNHQQRIVYWKQHCKHGGTIVGSHYLFLLYLREYWANFL